MSEGAAPPATLPLFFKRIEALDSIRHRSLRLRPRDNWAFARGSNAIPLTFSEIPRAAQEFPIVFAGDGDRLHIVALVGLTEAENLLIAPDGRWLGRYVPAYLRGYPFVFGSTGQPDNPFLVAIDPDADTLTTDDGEALFDDHGARTATLDTLVEFLRQYEAQMDKARRLARRVAELGLLVEVNADVRLRSGRQYEMTGLRVIDRSRLQQLPEADKLALFDSEWLEMIYHQFASLQTFSTLVDRLSERTGEAPAVA